MNLPLWFRDILFWSGQAAVLALAAGLLVKLLKIRDARALLVCWRVLIATSILLPFIEPWQRPQGPAATPAPLAISGLTVIPAAETVARHAHFPGWAAIADFGGVVLVAGIAGRLLLLALGLLKLRELRRTSSPIRANVECAATIEQTQTLAGERAEFRLSTEVESPVTFGFAAPVVLLPERFLKLDAGFQAAIASHELMHVRRRDWAHHLSEEIVRAVFWFHPAILWLVARVRLAREQVVDVEVVRLTKSRKVYVEALLEFATGRSAAAILAPPFLAERQFVERVALMLKEADMSRKRLIASLGVISCALAGTAILAVSVFPLKAAPRSLAGVQEAPAASKPVVDGDKIWPDKVARGTMYVDVGALGHLALLNGDPVAKLDLAEQQAVDIRVGQSAKVDTHKGIVEGHVRHISSEVENGTRSVIISLDSALPSGLNANASVEGTIVVAKLENVLYVGRPAEAKSRSGSQKSIVMPMFKIIDDGKEAEQVQVEFGRVSVTKIQVLSGLNPGDTIILSDMSPYRKFARIEIKPAG
jgi:beta-lactamase regulating signal transducer with metallopeptidase domain